MRRATIFLISAWGVYTLVARSAAADESNSAAAVRLSVVDTKLGPPAQYGLDRLSSALKAAGSELQPDAKSDFTLNVGTYGRSKQIQAWVDGKGADWIDLPKRPESLAVKYRDGKKTLVVAGYDDVGLMYALLDIADRIAHAPEPVRRFDWFNEVAECSESPQNSMRRMRVLMHHAANEKDWYHSLEYWDWYIGLLAENRFNGLNLVYSHQTPYMAPMYAWHVKVDEFPDVRPIGVSDEEREQNLAVMRHIAKLCHDRGIELTIGVWQHLPWIESYVKTRTDQKVLVAGLSGQNVGEYTRLALKKLLQECPGIARIQIRPNDESGIHLADQTAFYRDNVMKTIKEVAPHVKLDLRTVGVQPATIEAARKADLNVRTSIKFYGEFLGMPYTPREVLTVGYSYRDYLQKPMPNPVYNEVWMLGSHRALVWGSESYGREFGRNASYGGTIGFETDGPIAQKGYQQSDGPAWRFFKNREDEYFDHEIERYWAFFRAIGRFSYNRDTPREVWMRPFQKRFGAAAEAMASAYESASRVVGLIAATHVADANMYVWPEISMGGVIGAYNDLRGLDKGLFPAIQDQVDEELAGRLSGRDGAIGLAAIYESIAADTDAALIAATKETADPSAEFMATTNDFRILAHLARYHAHRQREGYNMAKFWRTSDASLLKPALAESEAAVAEWKKLTAIGQRQYYENMQTGPRENGHWQDKLPSVEVNPQIVREADKTLREFGIFDLGFDFGRPALNLNGQIFTAFRYSSNYFHERRFISIDPGVSYEPRTGYGFTENTGLDWTRNPMVYSETLSGVKPMPGTPLPLDMLGSDFVHSRKRFDFRMDFPKMDAYWFTFVFSDRSGTPRGHGPFNLEYGARHDYVRLERDIRVPATESVIRQFRQDVRRNWYPFRTFSFAPSAEGADAMVSALSVHRDAPNIAHAPVLRLSPDEACVLSATITMPPRKMKGSNQLSAAPGERLVNAQVHVRTDQDEPYMAAKLSSDDGFVFSAKIPRNHLVGKWLDYYFTATDVNGRAATLPEEPGVRPFRARIIRDARPPAIEHRRITNCKSSEPLIIRAQVNDPDGVAAVRVYFRTMNQTLPYERLEMERNGNSFVATIPAEAIKPDWDFVYYLEAVDEGGSGCFFPEWKQGMPYIIVTTK